MVGGYVDPKTGLEVSVSGDKFSFPTSGAKVLLKKTPPIARTVRSD